MKTKVCLFEDEHHRNFLPLTFTRSVYDLRCGIRTLAEKVIDLYPRAEVYLSSRAELEEVLRQRSPFSVNELVFTGGESCLFIDGRVISTPDLARLVPLDGEDRMYFSGDQLVAVRLRGERLSRLGRNFRSPLLAHHIDEMRREVPTTDIGGGKLVDYPWDLVHRNAEEIRRDFSRMGVGGQILGHIDPQAVIYNPSEVYVGEGSQIDACVFLDARAGPIFVDENVVIQSFTRVEGPAFIGRETILVGGKVRGGCSLGPACRVGGEVEESIIHGYSNKYHDGFIGHAYVGEWVNLGALTTNSDLKNNYRNVTVTIDGQAVDTGLTKVGSFIADHVKTGIGTLLNTGTVIGIASNIFGGGISPKSIPSFAWGGGNDFVEYDLRKGLETAQVTMARRSVKMTEADQTLWSWIFEHTREDRSAFIRGL